MPIDLYEYTPYLLRLSGNAFPENLSIRPISYPALRASYNAVYRIFVSDVNAAAGQKNGRFNREGN